MKTPPSHYFSDVAFRGRVFGVTGAAHGIGESIVLALLEANAFVLLLDKDDRELDRVKRQLGDKATEIAEFAHVDVRNHQDLRSAIQRTVDRWGRLDGWVNNAMYNPGGSVEEEKYEHFVQAFEVNVFAGWNAIRDCLPLMKSSGGSIVNVSSIMTGQAVSRNAAYIASKAALDGLTRTLAVELAPLGIRVNSLAPGFIRTGKDSEKPIERAYNDILYRASQPWPFEGTPADVAGAALFLLSDLSSFITGSTLVVDGGLSVELPLLTDPVRANAAEQLLKLEHLKPGNR
ncbi:MAG: SDR family oxidoreductase [Phycisphaerales bacterium]|jgi:NAD(P)-dependent dehydrogenase (short-subunit alcohol dehydrogenase family)|nr:SDR family oxidoreductase [Phycisphaerales bacterium]